MSELIPLSLTKDYVGHWGAWEALRELFQNAIDTPEYDIDFWNTTVEIKSNGGKLPKDILLLGKTSKRNDISKIGNFGEGSKLAMLVLLREGAEVVIYNKDEIWTPKFMYSSVFEEEILYVEVTPLEEDKRDEDWDVNIIVRGLDYSVLRKCRDNIIMEGDLEVASQSERGKAYYKHEDQEGDNANVYVKGLFVGTVSGKFKFDYDFNPEYLTLDRDRSTVSGYELQYEAAKLLHASGDIKLIASLAIDKYHDVGSLSENTYSTKTYSCDEKDQLAELSLKLFYEQNGEDAYPVYCYDSAVNKKIIHKLCQAKGLIPVEIDSTLYSLLKRKIPVLSGLDVLEKKTYTLLDKFIEKNKRKLYSKQLKELKELSALLKMKEGG